MKKQILLVVVFFLFFLQSNFNCFAENNWNDLPDVTIQPDPLPAPPESIELPDDLINKSHVTKAVIVAAGGPFLNGKKNNVWRHTRNCADHAFRSLRHQGLTQNDILYLSHQDPEINSAEVDQFEVTTQSISDAIVHFKGQLNEKESLLLYLMDHGGPEGVFYLGPDENLTADILHQMIFPIQNLVLIIESCYSGEMVNQLLAHPTQNEQNWILISSASNELAAYINGGFLSFSYQLFSGIRSGSNLNDSFHFGKTIMKYFQTATIKAIDQDILDENETLSSAQGMVIGDGMKTALDPPVIQDFKVQWQNGSLFFEVGPVISSFPLDSVWVNVRPPNFQAGAEPITMSIGTQLSDTNQDGIYTGNFIGCLSPGSYKFIAFSSFKHEGQPHLSLPISRDILISQSHSTKADLNSNCQVDLVDGIIALNIVAGGAEELAFPPADLAAIDVNGDYRIGLAEALYIMRHIVGLNN